jgi:unsaturated rhamnogalacturonyl hydrolase
MAARLLTLLFALAATASLAHAAEDLSTMPPPNPALGQGKIVALDYFFNHQVKNGKPFHYLWEDTALSGYSKFGDIWKANGATLAAVKKAPTLDDLRHYSVYIICDPNKPDKAADGKPNYLDPATGDAVEAWVKDGGVLLLFANDKANCEFDHYNTLASRFGITFNADLRNTVNHGNYAHATFSHAQFPDHPLFNNVAMIYMKEISTLSLKDPAQPLLTVDKEKEQGPGQDIIMATAHVGRGLVFAVGDPWLYNEYIDFNHGTPPLPVENRKAAVNLVQWLLAQASPPHTK